MQELRGSGLFDQQDADLSQFVHEYSTRKAQGSLVAAINEQRDIIFDGSLPSVTLIPLFCSKVSECVGTVGLVCCCTSSPADTPAAHDVLLQARARGSPSFCRQ